MPYSSDSGKKFVDRALLRLNTHLGDDFFNHKSILDVGAGSGTYSNLYSNALLPRTKFKWSAVEIWEPYIEKFELNKKYDVVHKTDILSFLKENEEFYDIIFMGDIIEHMTKEEAQEVMKLAQETSYLVIMSIPIVHYPQDEFEGNPYEAHVKDDWSTEEVLSSFSNIVHYGVENEIGVFLLGGTNNDHEIPYRSTFSPKIGVYGICKNEIQFTERFLDSVIDADQLVICDTGSTDGTYERLKEYEDAAYVADRSTGADGPDSVIIKQIAVMPFRFDDARNAAMAMLRPDLDLCISLDFDELLQDGWYDILVDEVNMDLRLHGSVLERYNHRFKTIWNWQDVDNNGAQELASEHWHERIHSREGYLWKLPVHEVLVKFGEPERLKWLGGFMMYQKPDQSKPRSSYLKMLEVSVKEDPNRWKTWSFLAGDLANAGRIHEAINAINKAKALPDTDRAYLSNQQSRIHQSQGHIREAVAEMLNAVMLAPHVREYKVYVARLYKANNDIPKAKSMLRMADEVTERTYGYEYDQSCWGTDFFELCASVFSTNELEMMGFK